MRTAKISRSIFSLHSVRLKIERAIEGGEIQTKKNGSRFAGDSKRLCEHWWRKKARRRMSDVHWREATTGKCNDIKCSVNCYELWECILCSRQWRIVGTEFSYSSSVFLRRCIAVSYVCHPFHPPHAWWYLMINSKGWDEPDRQNNSK